jgi:hypothetical protein
MFELLPIDVVNIILDYTGVIRFRKGKYMNQIRKDDCRYNIMKTIPFIRNGIVKFNRHFGKDYEFVLVNHSYDSRGYYVTLIKKKYEYKTECKFCRVYDNGKIKIHSSTLVI